jgi:hypothetical protein
VQDMGSDAGHPEDISVVLKGKPLLCLSFNDFVMHVPEATPWIPKGGIDAKLVTV